MNEVEWFGAYYRDTVTNFGGKCIGIVHFASPKHTQALLTTTTADGDLVEKWIPIERLQIIQGVKHGE